MDALLLLHSQAKEQLELLSNQHLAVHKYSQQLAKRAEELSIEQAQQNEARAEIAVQRLDLEEQKRKADQAFAAREASLADREEQLRAFQSQVAEQYLLMLEVHKELRSRIIGHADALTGPHIPPAHPSRAVPELPPHPACAPCPPSLAEAASVRPCEGWQAPPQAVCGAGWSPWGLADEPGSVHRLHGPQGGDARPADAPKGQGIQRQGSGALQQLGSGTHHKPGGKWQRMGKRDREALSHHPHHPEGAKRPKQGGAGGGCGPGPPLRSDALSGGGMHNKHSKHGKGAGRAAARAASWSGSGRKQREGDWVCSSCGVMNFRYRTTCMNNCSAAGPPAGGSGKGVAAEARAGMATQQQQQQQQQPAARTGILIPPSAPHDVTLQPLPPPPSSQQQDADPPSSAPPSTLMDLSPPPPLQQQQQQQQHPKQQVQSQPCSQQQQQQQDALISTGSTQPLPSQAVPLPSRPGAHAPASPPLPPPTTTITATTTTTTVSAAPPHPAVAPACSSQAPVPLSQHQQQQQQLQQLRHLVDTPSQQPGGPAQGHAKHEQPAPDVPPRSRPKGTPAASQHDIAHAPHAAAGTMAVATFSAGEQPHSCAPDPTLHSRHAAERRPRALQAHPGAGSAQHAVQGSAPQQAACALSHGAVNHGRARQQAPGPTPQPPQQPLQPQQVEQGEAQQQQQQQMEQEGAQQQQQQQQQEGDQQQQQQQQEGDQQQQQQQQQHLLPHRRFKPHVASAAPAGATHPRGAHEKPLGSCPNSRILLNNAQRTLRAQASVHGPRGWQGYNDDTDAQELAVTVQRLQWEEQHLQQAGDEPPPHADAQEALPLGHQAGAGQSSAPADLAACPLAGSLEHRMPAGCSY